MAGHSESGGPNKNYEMKTLLVLVRDSGYGFNFKLNGPAPTGGPSAGATRRLVSELDSDPIVILRLQVRSANGRGGGPLA